ncbi:hypothetical protein A3Q56_07975 [Intoshia linei]|uniref:Uncharacterized protein n=1 Tax=Intoshia linei TaxID=1819745 RepID=A0A177ASD3_9BILA|nr:hypothetical protein A3Q56_07975 [Intoshia linei]
MKSVKGLKIIWSRLISLIMIFVASKKFEIQITFNELHKQHIVYGESKTSKLDILVTFLETAPINKKSLAMKAVAIVGFFGELRSTEIVNILINDFTVTAIEISIAITQRKTDLSGKGKFYFLISKSVEGVFPFKIINEYISLRSVKSMRLFQNFN